MSQAHVLSFQSANATPRGPSPVPTTPATASVSPATTSPSALVNSPAERQSTAESSGSERFLAPQSDGESEEMAGPAICTTKDTLSRLADQDSYVAEEMTKDEHIAMLAVAKEKAIAEGYMLPQEDFDQIHYEDPKVTELKSTDVSGG